MESSGSEVRAQWEDKEIEPQRRRCGWKGLSWGSHGQIVAGGLRPDPL